MKNDELDDEWNPTKIKIPKVPPGFYELQINRRDVVEVRGKYTVTLKKQTVGGHVIPHGTIMTVIWFHESGSVTVSEKEVNNLLRVMIFDSLRTKKK
jgi:hypothetical protein